MGMSNESSSNCPQCGNSLPADAPKGLCPNCLMALNMRTETVFTGVTPPAQPPLPPEKIAPYFPQLEILECLGRGGMGVVYKARQKTLNRVVALKLLAPERVNDTKFAERFTREAQALAALNHPNIVTIYDFGQAGGFYYLLMEFVDGLNLRRLLRARKFTPEEALAIVPPLCDALQFAHDRGIVHRDIKPENLLLDKTGRIKVADFGIAKMLGAPGDRGGAVEHSAPENATRTAVGTPVYSAPEQKADPQRVDSRADIYSLGVVFYELLTGELPGKQIEPPSRKVHIDVRLDQVVLRALEQNPELRYQQVSEVKTMVETIAASPGDGPVVPATKPRFLRVATWVSAGLAILIFGWFAFVAYHQSANRLYSATGTIALVSPKENKTPPGKFLQADLNAIVRSPKFIYGVISNLNLNPAFASGQPFVGRTDNEIRGILEDRTHIWRIPHTDNYEFTVAGNSSAGTVVIANEIAKRLSSWTHETGLPDGRVVEIFEPATPNQDHTRIDVILTLVFGVVLGGGIGRIVYGLLLLGFNLFALAAIKGRPRLCRSAVVGAICALLSFLPMAWLLWWLKDAAATSTRWGDSSWINVLFTVMGLTGLVLIAPLVATVLGWWATIQIRHSEGRLCGLKLSLFDGLLFPLLLLDSAITSLFLLLQKILAHHVWRLSGSLFFGASDFAIWLLILLEIVIWADFRIVRRVWRAVKQPLPGSPPVDGSRRQET
jgi:serine/threonine protein kinase